MQDIDISNNLTRKCPLCKKEIKYSNQRSLQTANKHNRKCKKCSANDPNKKAKLSLAMSGKGNPFYGKKHSEATREILALKTRESWKKKTPEELERARKVCVNKGDKNGMYGKSVHTRLVELYGKEEGDQRWINIVTKKKGQNSGEKSYMFGKPPPRGAGNGWKCWYNGNYFRSLRELCFILEIEEKGLEWKSAENIRIPYMLEGKRKTYAPDFIIGNNLYEIKPIKLHNSKTVYAKAEAARLWCLDNNLNYILTDVKINSEKLKELYINKKITFDYRYVERFLQYINLSRQTP